MDVRSRSGLRVQGGRVKASCGEMSEESTPKAGGVKAMLAALNAKKSHVVLPDGTVPGGKASWNTPKKDPAAPAQPKPNSSAASKDEPAGKRHAPAEGGMESPGSGSLTQDEMRAVREAVAAKRGAGQSPAAGRGRGGSATPGSEKFTQPSSDTALRGPLPEGWHEKTDPTTGQVFWVSCTCSHCVHAGEGLSMMRLCAQVNHEKKLRSWTDPRLPRQASGRGRGRGWLSTPDTCHVRFLFMQSSHHGRADGRRAGRRQGRTTDSRQVGRRIAGTGRRAATCTSGPRNSASKTVGHPTFIAGCTKATCAVRTSRARNGSGTLQCSSGPCFAADGRS